MEQWKDIPGYEGLYLVSNLGRVKRVFKNGAERFLKGSPDKDGYTKVILSSNQVKKHCKVHRLVAEAFVPNTDHKPQINHKDRCKSNNVASNLEWVTAAENTRHCVATGRRTNTKAVIQYTKDMRVVAVWDSVTKAAKSLNISPTNICTCCNGGLSSSGGFVWRHKGVSI
jgi:hypothetical protein